jgi:predicted dehydrogenase
MSLIGAGNFARLVMMPALEKVPGISWRGLATAKGMNAEHSGRKMDFAFATTDVDAIFSDAATKAVFIATRHDLHADLVISALRAGKHVFVEKPLCITPEQLEAIDACVRELGDKCPAIMVGFNRRFAPATNTIRNFFAGVRPLSIAYRFAPGPIPPNAWPQDEDIGGGRIVGEACHAIDVCVALTGSEPVRVFAESVGQRNGLLTSDDSVFITMRHRDGTLSNISYQAGGDRAASPERLEVFGGGRTCYMEGWGEIELFRGEKRTVANGAKDKGHAAEFRAFVDAIRAGGDSPISWNDIYGTTWASIMAVRSLREGIAFDIDG